MKKFFPKKKKASAEVEQSSRGLTSPLVPSSDDSAASSRGRTEAQREARLKERAERRDQREKRNEEINSERSAASGKSKSKKNSKPRLTQEEQDAQNVNLGCCHNLTEILVKIIHFVDAAIGLTFVVYGGLIYEEFEQPAMEAVITSLTYGSVLLFTSLMGVLGFAFKGCSRFGLLISSWTAPFISFFYIFVMIAMIGGKGSFFSYLNEHKSVMYLNDAEIEMLMKLLPFFYITVAGLLVIEMCRFFVVRQVRKQLILRDNAVRRIASNEGSNRSNLTSNAESNRSNLTEPLMNDEEV